ncbi:MAG: hypothetical protein AB8C95_02935 [Phycisphaeraceae bacterium]
MSRFVLISLPVFLLIIGCNKRTPANMQTAIADTVQNEPQVTEFHRLYPNAEHFITYYTPRYGDPIWNSKVTIDSRTELTMQFDIDLDRTGLVMTRTTTPKFHILTTKKITKQPNGQTVIHHGPGMELGPDEWKQIVASDGDVGVVSNDRK